MGDKQLKKERTKLVLMPRKRQIARKFLKSDPFGALFTLAAIPPTKKESKNKEKDRRELETQIEEREEKT